MLLPLLPGATSRMQTASSTTRMMLAAVLTLQLLQLSSTSALEASPIITVNTTGDAVDSTWSFRSALIAASTAQFPVTINFDLPANSTILLDTTGGNTLPMLTGINLTVNGTLPDGSRVTIGDSSAADSTYPTFQLTGTANTAFTNIVFRATFFQVTGGSPDATLSFYSCELYGTAPVDISGSAILLQSGKLSMLNSAARDFRSSSFGGVIRVPSGSSNPTTVDLTDCHFENNVAKEGGAIKSSSTYMNLTGIRTKFVNNQARQYFGGAINLYQASSVSIEDSEFIGNSAASISGAGGAIFMEQSSSLFTLLRCRFAQNSAGAGGAILLDKHAAAQTLIKQCVLRTTQRC